MLGITSDRRINPDGSFVISSITFVRIAAIHIPSYHYPIPWNNKYETLHSFLLKQNFD